MDNSFEVVLAPIGLILAGLILWWTWTQPPKDMSPYETVTCQGPVGGPLSCRKTIVDPPDADPY